MLCCVCQAFEPHCAGAHRRCAPRVQKSHTAGSRGITHRGFKSIERFSQFTDFQLGFPCLYHLLALFVLRSATKMERNWEGIRCASVPYKNCGFSGKGTQRNPPSGNPQSGKGIPFLPLRENRLFSHRQKKGQPASGLKCCGLSSATSGLQVLLFSFIFSCFLKIPTAQAGERAEES